MSDVALPTRVSVPVGIVIAPPLTNVVIVLLVSVSVVSLPTKVSVDVGRVNVPVLLIDDIIGVVNVLFSRVSTDTRETNVLSAP